MEAIEETGDGGGGRVKIERRDQIIQRKESGKEQTSSKVRRRVTRTEETAGRQAGWSVTGPRLTGQIRRSDTNVTTLTFPALALSLFITSFSSFPSRSEALLRWT